MKIKDICFTLSSALYNHFEGKKVTLTGEFHPEVREIIELELTKIGLQDQLSYYTWKVTSNDNYRREFMTLVLDLKEDKRSKWETKGKVLNVSIAPVKAEYSDLTIEECKKYMDEEERQEQIQRAKEQIAKLEAELAENKQWLNELESKGSLV